MPTRNIKNYTAIVAVTAALGLGAAAPVAATLGLGAAAPVAISASDGSVRTHSDAISQGVLGAIGTRDGGEVMPDF